MRQRLATRLGALAVAILAMAAPRAAAPTDVPVQEDYTLHCQACHGPDGEGTPGVTPSLRDIGPLLDAPGGRAYLARVPGVAQAPLSDARLARLLNWVLARHAGTPPRPPYSPAEIGVLRRAPLRDTRAAREALVPTDPGAPSEESRP